MPKYRVVAIDGGGIRDLYVERGTARSDVLLLSNIPYVVEFANALPIDEATDWLKETWIGV